jgi:hypothetical protein
LKKTSDTKKRCRITQLEAVAVVWAVNVFRDPYLYGKKFCLITDHKALLKLQTMSPENNMTLEHWSMKLAEFNIEIPHWAGSKLVNADCISYNQIDLVNSITYILEGTPAFVKAQQKNKFHGLIYEKVQKIELQETSIDIKLLGNKLVVENKALYWVNRNSPKWQKFWINDNGTLQETLIVDKVETTQIYIPENFVPDILQAIMRKDIGVISLLLRDCRKSSIGEKCTRTQQCSAKCVTPVRSVTKGRSVLDDIYMFVFSGHLSISLPTLSPPATLYLDITNEAGQQGIEVC